MAITDIEVGKGTEAKAGMDITVHYSGSFGDGTVFNSTSRDNENRPITFKLQQGSLIEGWVRGIPGMKVGGKRKLIIPPELGYGAKGSPPVIPPNATLIFEIELLEAQ